MCIRDRLFPHHDLDQAVRLVEQLVRRLLGQLRRKAAQLDRQVGRPGRVARGGRATGRGGH
eukprot:12705384-Alexandrium_andersonii.AAC.1